MSEYTFRELAVRPKVAYVGYKDYAYAVNDTSLTSPDYFEIVEFPSKLTAGKNLIKLRANRDNLVNNSNINVEILDYNGDAVYYKPIRYSERDGTRVIAIYIYPETSPGPARIYLTGRARFDQSGNELRSSQDYSDSDYINRPNLIWSRSITIAPDDPNSTEIIFVKQPQVLITESVQPYFQPITTTNVFTKITGSGIPSDLSQGFGYQTNLPVSSPPPILPAAFENENGEDANDITVTITPANVFTSAVTVGDTIEESGAATTSNPVSIVVGNGVDFTLSPTTSTSNEEFSFTTAMEDGVITVTNPLVLAPNGTNAYVFGTEQNGFDVAIPVGMNVAPTKMVQINSAGQVRLYGTWTFGIRSVQNATKARVVQIDGYDNNFFNTNDAPLWRFLGNSATFTGFPANMNSEAAVAASGFDVTSNRIESANNFTSSFIEPYVVTETENSASFADIILSNIEPETGDVYKVKTLFKPSGMFGDFIDLGDTILEEQELLIDTESFETNVTVGAVYEHFGRFESLDEINTYWELYSNTDEPDLKVYGTVYSTNIVSSPIARNTLIAYDDANLLGGAKVDFYGPLTALPVGSYQLNQATLFKIKSAYQPKLYANTTYKVRAKLLLHSIDSLSEDSRIPFPRLDVYVSGSKPTLLSENIIIAGNASLPNNWQETLTGDFADGSEAGYHLGTVTCPEVVNTRIDVEFLFKVEADVPKANLGFMLRSGDWTIADVELKSYKESGFSPNYVRIGKRVPTEHLNTPLTFKFQYYDYTGKLANQQTTAYGVVFQGDNFYIDGVNNILTGSLFLGNTIGTGVEMAGVNSAFIRSVGYYGYSASLATGNDKNGGFLIYSGSVLPQEKNYFGDDIYKGVGMELVADDDSGHLIFHTNPSILDIKARSFFIGNTATQFISGANSNIEISSSLFHLDPSTDTLTIGAAAVINAPVSVNEIFTPATIAGSPSTITNASSSITSDGFAKFVSASIGGFNVSADRIYSNDNAISLRADGVISGSVVRLAQNIGSTEYVYLNTQTGVADFSNIGRTITMLYSTDRFTKKYNSDIGTSFKTMLSENTSETGSIFIVPMTGETQIAIAYNWYLEIEGGFAPTDTVNQAAVRAKLQVLESTGSANNPNYWISAEDDYNTWTTVETSTNSILYNASGDTSFTYAIPPKYSGWKTFAATSDKYRAIYLNIPESAANKLCRVIFETYHNWSNVAGEAPTSTTGSISNVILQTGREFAASITSGSLEFQNGSWAVK
jgi:hypothetical protein